MSTAETSEEIIILSDDDDDDDGENDVSCSEPSVVVVELEDVETSDVVFPQSAVDEDLVVTFSRRAEVLSHARYDCPIHPFKATENEIHAPVADNQLFCDQCFCYICDKLASLCAVWCDSGRCHCNSHKRSIFWLNLRNGMLLGGLNKFNLSLWEIDAHLRQAEMLLQSFRQGLSELFSVFLKGKTLKEYGINQASKQDVIHDYTPVFEFVSGFLNEADTQDARAAAIMRLGAAEDFTRHFQASGTFIPQSPMANAAHAKSLLLQRVIASLQRQMVMGDLTPEFTLKLQDFYKRLYFPTEMKNMRNSLGVRPWDDILLVSVLKGQNVSGVRKDKGKKDVLLEPVNVVLLRTELLQQQHKYRELYRYLRVIQTDDTKVWQQLQDLLPFFKCMDGDMVSAVNSLFPSVNAPASRLTPSLFMFYLRVFQTSTAPKLIVSKPTQLCCSEATWEPIKDAVPLKRVELVKFALRVHPLCSAVYADSQCWTHLLTIFNTPCASVTALPAPNPEFLQEARVIINSLLRNLNGSNIQIPRFFQEAYPDQALLLLVTGALSWRILSAALSPVVPVLNTFKENTWALAWLMDSLGLRLNSFLQEVTQEMEIATDSDKLLPFLQSNIFTLPSSAETWDHTYCCPAALKLCIAQVTSPV